MRINIIGSAVVRDSAVRLRGMLRLSEFVVVDSRADFTVHLVGSQSDYIEVDGIDCELERHIINMIAGITSTGILLQRVGGIQSDTSIRVGIPKRTSMATADPAAAVENGIYRALLMHTRQSPKISWWARLLAMFALVFMFATIVSAQNTPIAGATIKVNCVTGCSGSSPANQAGSGTITGSGQTVTMALAGVGTAAVQITGTWAATLEFEGSIDDSTFFSLNAYPVTSSTGATNTTANGNWFVPSAGLHRLRVRSSAYTSGTATITVEGSIGSSFVLTAAAGGGGGGLTDTQLRATPVPVSGTFWQATQPVSGTFFQATQPVSIASMPSTPVTGTFWQATQPVSGTVTANAGTNLNTSALSLEATQLLVKAKTDNLDVALSTRTKPADQQHTIIDSSASIAVTGPLTDTQLRASAVPVSGTVTANLAAGSNVIGHVIADTGSTTAVTGNVTVVQGTGTNLHAVLDTTSTTAVTQATGTNLHAVVDSGTITTVSSVTQNADVRQATGTNLHTVVDSGTVTANAGTNLNTSLLALESGGNLAIVASPVGTPGSASPGKVEMSGGIDETNAARAPRMDTRGVTFVYNINTGFVSLPKQPCNAVRRTNCQ